jgi:predicted porin
MKKALLPLVIAAAALPLSSFAEVTVYGKANVSLQNADEYNLAADDNESTIELVSNASRIGLKGSEEINSSLKAIYQFEYQTEVDDGNNGGQTFGQRNIYVGLQGTGGTIIGGKFDTPVKVLQEKVDLFNDLEGDIAFLLDGETRSNNIVQYTTPLFADSLAINVAYVSSENPDVDDGKSVSITYTTPTFYIGVATEQDVSTTLIAGAQNLLDISRVATRLTLGSVQLGALYETSESDVGEYEADGWLVSAKLNATDALAFKVQYGNAGDDELTATNMLDGDDMQLNVGVDYLLSKNTMIFAYYTQEETEDTSTVILTDVATTTETDNSWLGVGMELKF